MREIIEKLVKESIIFKYTLPNSEKNIPSSKYSTMIDTCFTSETYTNLAKLIYNAIIDYANNSYDIDYENLDREQIKTIINKLRYEEDAKPSTKLKYGFYGEILLYCILLYFFGTEVIVAKGYFYNILEGGEPKGYDCFHLLEKDGNVDLWFGEAKCYQNYVGAIKDVLNKIENAISDSYLNKNIIAIIKEKRNFTTRNSIIEEICNEWEENPSPNVLDEIKKHNMKLVYPILIVTDIKDKEYDQYIREIINFIEEEYKERDIKFKNSFLCDIFFIFLPVKGTREMKEQVIKWISEKKPLEY